MDASETPEKREPREQETELEELEEHAGMGEEDRSDTPLAPEDDPHPDLPADA